MDEFNMPIGGEFWFENKLQDKNIYNDISNIGVLLNGGKSAIEFILNDINFKENEILALPSYLCPTIIEVVENIGIKYEFYEINQKLELKIETLKNLIAKFNVKVVFFIDYFGFYQKENVRSFLKSLKSQKIILIEDAVQSFWIKRQQRFIGNYIFNSYRKFLPIDGSIVLCNKNIELESVEDDYFNIVEQAREKKRKFISEGTGEERDFLKLFDRAHREYYKRKKVYRINQKYKEFLNHIPVEALIKKRKENYKYLFSNLKNISDIEFIYDDEDLNNSIPLAFPIFLINRDYVRKELMKNNIYAPIHWDLREEKWIKNFEASLNISKNILSLPIDWRYGIENMDYLVRTLKTILR
ncbi:DegT/DnrJ/EryC1/StrS aminotransferase family protein [Clostridium weizhouense]|uniref:DegT/DnrJ/EryC1/StrS aminotransferase family protein n=1 Tax=Clostridium weizhouense TaxID=2859781 RepID=A0ABS7ALD8_9CLOT|nr:DegT/DnrJ/EryC1/StrS aminotransferase family protein [Clostridium weizhouense]MBW6409469.1 DegT/DnrJ/EryC1/StrS aminotransferase family protein [Clostridium weizhouense]